MKRRKIDWVNIIGSYNLVMGPFISFFFALYFITNFVLAGEGVPIWFIVVSIFLCGMSLFGIMYVLSWVATNDKPVKPAAYGWVITVSAVMLVLFVIMASFGAGWTAGQNSVLSI